jgi:hypothetical protein
MKFTKTVVAALAIGTSAVAMADGVEWSGFGSVYYAQAFDQQMLPSGYTSNKMDFTKDSLLGLNIASRLGDNLSAAAQIVSAGASGQSSNFTLYTQWANLTYSFTNSLNVKLGRQLLPILISSEYQRVHYLLPTNGAPSVASSVAPFVSIDGGSINNTFELGDLKLLTSIYGGTPILDVTPPSSLTYKGTSLLGVRATLDGSGWRAHLNYFRNHSKITISNSSVEANNNVYSAGFRVEKYNVVFWTEGAYSKGQDNTVSAITGKRVLSKSYGWYTLAGYRVAKFLPYLAVGANTSALGFLPKTNGVSYDGKVATYTAGVNYQINEQAVFKVSYNRTRVPSIGGGNFLVTQQAASTKRDANAVSAGVDFIF